MTPKERYPLILDLYKTHSSREVGLMMGISYKTVWRIVQKYGYKKQVTHLCSCGKKTITRENRTTTLCGRCRSNIWRKIHKKSKCFKCGMSFRFFPKFRSEIKKYLCVGCDGSEKVFESSYYQSSI